MRKGDKRHEGKERQMRNGNKQKRRRIVEEGRGTEGGTEGKAKKRPAESYCRGRRRK